MYDTARDGIAFDTFSNLGRYLPPRSLLVLNDTKVVPARAVLRKETGGKVEVLFLVNEWRRPGPVPALVDRKVSVGARLYFDAGRSLAVVRQDGNIFYLKPDFPDEKLFEILDRRGVMPIPKYIKHSGLSEADLREKYQTVFGRVPASVAAPTASLHMTRRLLGKLERQGVRKTFVTLNVGLGTFAPVSDGDLAAGTLHRESLEIPAPAANMIRAQKRAGRPVVAVGTTVVRTLEAGAARILAGGGGKGGAGRRTRAISGATRIFIRPPYEFKIVDALVTNFHLPGTSLMMLVQAFLEHRHAKRTVVDLYRAAIAEKFRFYSFGDAMLLR